MVEEPTIPLIEALMSDPTTDVIVATGGTAVVRAAYRSGNPAIGVGPGNVPVLVDATADLAAAAARHRRLARRSTTRSCAPTSPCSIVEERFADAFDARAAAARRATCSTPTSVDAVRATLLPRRAHCGIDLVGKDAPTLAGRGRASACRPSTRVLVAPFALVVPEEPLAREKLFPLLGLVRVPDARRGIDAARAMLRIGGAGHSAVIHSSDPRTIMAYGARCRCCGSRSTSAAAPASPAWTRTSRRR